MKDLFRLASVSAAAVVLAGSVQAATVLNDWYFNPNGTGLGSATQIHENLDFVGQGFIDLTPTGANTFNFTEHAAFRIDFYDGGTSLPAPNFITAVFQASGSGTFNGAFSFTGGTLTFYSDTAQNFGSSSVGGFINGANDGAAIGTFSVLPGGGGFVDPTGSPVTNGAVTVNVKALAGALPPGYWFNPAGNDLTALDTLAFAFTNANALQSASTALKQELACDYAGFGGPLCVAGVAQATAPSFAAGDYLFVGNNGQFKLTVPEPTGIALAGLALALAGAATRRRKAV